MIDKSTFCKVLYRIRRLTKTFNGLEEVLGTDIESLHHQTTMLLQALEEATECCWEDRIFDMIYSSDKDETEIYREVMKYCLSNHLYTGIKVQDIQEWEIINHNSVVSINEHRVDEDGVGYYEEVWRGMCHSIPKKYLPHIGQIHGVLADLHEDILKSDCVHIMLTKVFTDDELKSEETPAEEEFKDLKIKELLKRVGDSVAASVRGIDWSNSEDKCTYTFTGNMGKAEK